MIRPTAPGGIAAVAAYRVNTLLTSIADAGRELLRIGGQKRPGIDRLCHDLLSTRGEASGAALARELVEAYRALDEDGKLAFFRTLLADFDVDPERIEAAVEDYLRDPGFERLQALRRVAEPPRQELFRRMNMAPNGTRALVAMRAELLRRLPAHPELRRVDADMHHLLTSWFNPGFLTLARIDWNSPASLLEKIVRYEKVHRIPALEALRRRLAADRRCFAFFHPALPDEPLIFVEVALTKGMADRVQSLIDENAPIFPVEDADTAVFYSINNCQDGLRGVNLGNFLIKLVVADLERELPRLRHFVTLSPVPGFRRWLEEARSAHDPVTEPYRELLDRLAGGDWVRDEALVEQAKPVLLGLCAHYLVRVRERGLPRDPVARFHLRNGARLERINWLADTSDKGLAESFGILVNYRYDPARIERHHEAYVATGEVIHTSAVKSLLPAARTRS
jgi:malonyl-CoA decarboxylase